jgi:ribosome-associated protein
LTSSSIKDNLSAAKKQDINELIIQSISDMKGQKVLQLDMRSLEDAPADYFIICEGTSSTQLRAIRDNIREQVKSELDTVPFGTEGMDSTGWVLVDYINTVVHIFHPETRQFYDLEELWNDAKMITYTDN